MIKVNLLRNLGETRVVNENTVSQTIQIKDINSEEKIRAVWKVVLILVPLIALYLFESRNIRQKNDELTGITSQLTHLQSETTLLETKYGELKGYKDEGERLNKLIGAIAVLSKERLSAIRALDALQSLTPRRVWFISLNLTGEKINVQGVGASDDDVTEFIKELSDSVFFSNVETVSVEEVKKKYGAVRKFELNCMLEVPNG